MGALWADWKSKKIIVLKCYLFIVCNNNKPFLSQVVMCNENWILNDNWWWPAQCLDQEEALKHCPKLNLHQKRSWSLFGGLLPIWSTWSTIAFSILAKPLYLSSMLSKSMRWTKNCNRHWSKDGPNSSPRQRLTTSRMTNISKVEQIRLQSFALSAIFAWLLVGPTTTSSSMLTTFCQESSSTTSRMQKMPSKSLSNPEARIFTI